MIDKSSLIIPQGDYGLVYECNAGVQAEDKITKGNALP